MEPDSKPPVLWSSVIARWGMLVVIVIAIVVAFRPSLTTWMAYKKTFEVAGDPTDIRLVAVVPDGDNDLYDPQHGNKMAETLDWPGKRTLNWGQGQLQRDFLFELGPGAEEIVFPQDGGALLVSDSDQRGWVNPTVIQLGAERFPGPQNRPGFLVRLTVSEFSWRRRSLFGSGRQPIGEVNLLLHFFQKARGKANVTIDAPFVDGRTNTPLRAGQLLVKALTNAPGVPLSSSSFRIWQTSPGMWGMQVFVYDKAGGRHIPELTSSPGTPINGISSWTPGAAPSMAMGWTNEFVITGVPFSNVAAITIGEQPREKQFLNVRVAYPDRPPALHSPLLDRLVTALGRPNLSTSAVENYSPRSTEEAMTILDSLPGSRTAMSMLAHFNRTTNFSELPPARREQLRILAMKWTRHSDDYGRQIGLRTGLRGGWPEFRDIALARLTNGSPQERLETAETWSVHGNGLSQEHLPLLIDLLRTNDTPAAAPYLMSLLLHIGGVAATNAVLEAARSEDPVVWWSAISRLQLSAFKPFEALSDEMRQRIWIVRETTLPALTPSNPAEAQSRLASLLTAGMRAASFHVFDEVRRAIPRRLGRQSAMDAYDRYLRAGAAADWKAYPPAEIVRQINGWHLKNFGGIGTSEKPGNNYPSPDAWPGIVEDVLEFLDQLNKGQPKP